MFTGLFLPTALSLNLKYVIFDYKRVQWYYYKYNCIE